MRCASSGHDRETATDAFGGFLGVRAEVLDERGVDGEEVARRLHLSRIQPSIAGLRNRLAVAGPEFPEQVRAVCDEGRLDELIVCPGETVEIYTFGAVVAHVLTFAAHRRTLLAGALSDEGFTDLDSGDPLRRLSSR